MDLLLQHFVRYHFDVLSEQDKQNFEVLLNESDLDIMAWISGLRPCPCPQYTPLIKLLSEFQR